MRPTTTLALLRQLRDSTRKLYELELADLDRQIRAIEDSESRRVSTRATRAPDSRETDRTMLRAMQEGGADRTPMRTADIIARTGAPRSTIQRWLALMTAQRYLERVGKGRYLVAKEVPML